MASFNYHTVAEDRIDILAGRFYGSMAGISILADANPFVPLDAVYPIGTVLIVPLIEENQVIENQNLPPWKRP